MKRHILLAALIGLLIGTAVVGIVPAHATTPSASHHALQAFEPFEEVQPGVYLYWQWWNESYTESSPSYPNGSDDWSDGWDDDWSEPNWTPADGGEFFYYVMDTDGNGYWIAQNMQFKSNFSWTWNNLLVSIVVDPDGSYVSWLSGQGIEEDIWEVIYSEEPEALTGDEIVVFSGFYYADTYSSYLFNISYEWYDEEMHPVDPNTVIPNLAEGYEWAAAMNESISDSFEWSYKGFGYDIHEMAVVANQTRWMEHYFMGMSAFNDTNGNGVLDLVYNTIGIDFNGDGQVDWTYQELNDTASETAYAFYSEEAELGAVRTPFVNSDGQIEWGAEVTDIDGAFYSDDYWASMMPAMPGGYEMGWGEDDPSEPVSIPATVDSMSMTYRFEMTDTAAVLKIDQYVGDFHQPGTSDPVPELEGLSLSLAYWSTFSTYNLTVESDDEIVFGDDYEAEEELVIEPVPVSSGDVSFQVQDDLLASVNFGGTYVWGRDGQTYDVGTALYPLFEFEMPFEQGGGEGAFLTEAGPLSGGVYYYSSSYKNWDGYSITHDPMFEVYPDVPPGQVSSYVSGLVTASTVLSIGGVIAVVAVVARIYVLRKRK